VKRMGVEVARRTLEDLGFEVDTEHAELYLGLGYVAGSDPDAGTRARKGSTITLFLV
jgi:eukaryotic-like serine/threonine-protein kinase